MVLVSNLNTGTAQGLEALSTLQIALLPHT